MAVMADSAGIDGSGEETLPKILARNLLPRRKSRKNRKNRAKASFLPDRVMPRRCELDLREGRSP